MHASIIYIMLNVLKSKFLLFLQKYFFVDLAIVFKGVVGWPNFTALTSRLLIKFEETTLQQNRLKFYIFQHPAKSKRVFIIYVRGRENLNSAAESYIL